MGVALTDHYTRIFLLSHMRAFTSLMGHILGSHPRINGYFEMQLSYEDASAMEKQFELFRQSERLKENSEYLFDKILHNEFVFKPELLGAAKLKILVGLRKPEQTIKSIIHLFARKDVRDLYASPVEATKYYIDRLQALGDFCSTTRYPYYYFDAELLQAKPERLLPLLTRWFALSPALSERYEVFSQTGVAGRGDTSNVIQSGNISKSKTDYSHINIPGECLEKASEVYRECRQRMIEYAVESAVND